MYISMTAGALVRHRACIDPLSLMSCQRATINDSFDQGSMMPTMDRTVTSQRSLLPVQDCRQVWKAGSWSPLGGSKAGS